MSDDIVNRIDAQLAAGEEHGTSAMCFHCHRHWHGLPITERVAEMYDKGLFDETYRTDTDTSRILCPGSEFIGPVHEDAMSVPAEIFHAMEQALDQMLEALSGIGDLNPRQLREMTAEMSMTTEKYRRHRIWQTRRLLWMSWVSLTVGVLFGVWVLLSAAAHAAQGQWGWVTFNVVLASMNYWTIRASLRNRRANKATLAELKAEET